MSIQTENLNLTFEDGVAFMTVTGPVGETEETNLLTWLKDLAEEHDEFNMCVDIAKMEFPDLGSISKEIKRLGYVWRQVRDIEKCAVLSDSIFLRNSVKVEDAVIPGTKIAAFKLVEQSAALTWLGTDVDMPYLANVDDDEAKDEPVVDEAMNAWAQAASAAA